MRPAPRIAAGVIALGFVAACFSKDSAPEPSPDRVSPHGQQIDDGYATALAMFKAPEGATPCESALNAFVAEADAARKLGRPSLFTFVADREAFLEGCKALGSEAQACLVPRYAARHRDGCLTALPSDDKLAHLYVRRESSEERRKEPPLPTPKP